MRWLDRIPMLPWLPRSVSFPGNSGGGGPAIAELFSAGVLQASGVLYPLTILGEP